MIKIIRYFFIAFVVISICFFAVFIFIFRPYSFGDPPLIPFGWGYHLSDKFKGQVAKIKPIKGIHIPQNPFLNDSTSQNMHADTYASDTHPIGGPLGQKPTIKSYSHGRVGGECACVTFDSRNNIVAMCATFKEFSLLLLSPKNLKPLARLNLPPRASNKTYNLRKIMSDTSGGAYFFLDNLDRAVLVDADQNLKIIAQRWENGQPQFVIEKTFDLLPLLIKFTSRNDVFTSVLPDWNGRYWFVSRGGIVGYLDPITKATHAIKLQNEEIQNSFVIDENGVYVVSDSALYGITIEEGNDNPVIIWRETYEISSLKKPGTITNGSGSTPTLIGEKFIAITDNATPKINVLVYRRGFSTIKSRLVCQVPVFKAGKSATENTLIGLGNSIIVENNFGYDLFPTMMFGKTGEGGLSRVDFNEETGEGSIIWTNPIISQTTVPKLSLETGLIYVYAKDPSVRWGIDAYYFSAIDFETGETVFQQLTGTGVSYDNNWAPITIGPDRSAYIGVLRGLVKISDGDND